MHDMRSRLEPSDFPPIARTGLQTVQVNVGYKCNQSCLHCHVNAGPGRTEAMELATMRTVLRFLERSGASTLDITGGAPELNPHFRFLVEAARALGAHVMDRCNLTILEQPEQEGLADFLAAHGVEIVASLPCYLERNVDAQRGTGVFASSLRALQALNRLGYGQPDSGLTLNLVYNPQGPVLPPEQTALEAEYHARLHDAFGIRFNRLYVLTNMPIQRFGSTLVTKGEFEHYMALLKQAYQPANLDTVMCRSLVSIDWEGYVYDCDFNQMLDLPLAWRDRARSHLRELLSADLTGNPIAVRNHCYGCTARQGSSCGGALS